MQEVRPVLVVDDDADGRELLAEAFTSEGYTVLTAANGREALDLLTTAGQIEPLIIILDMEMPIMSGWEFLHTIRRYHRLAAIPVVVQSGSPSATEGHRPGAVSAFLTKPYDAYALVARVKRGEFGSVAGSLVPI